ncbi:Integrase core domain protein [compost metagenome]
MDTFGHRTTDHSILKNNVIVCDTQRLHVRETTSPVYLSVAMHAVSREVLGWSLSDRYTLYQSLQHAIQMSLTKGTHCGVPEPCYLVDTRLDSRSIAQALNDMGIEVRFYNSMSHDQSAIVERFFKDFKRTLLDGLGRNNGDLAEAAPSTLATMRKRFNSWLKCYQQRPPLPQFPADDCPSGVSPPSACNRSEDRKQQQPIDHKQALRQRNPQRGRRSI